MISGNWDLELLLALNSLVGRNKLLWDFANNPLFRGFPIFVPLVALWFFSDCRKRRSRMLAGLLATCLATLVSVWFQFHINVHTRPLLDPTFHSKIVLSEWTLNWERKSSFPSDTATLFFSLAAVIFLENRLLGFLCFLWVAAIVGIARVAFLFHYPSDIVGSLILGAGSVFLFHKIQWPEMLAERALKLFEGRMYVVHALLFIFLADAFNLFQSVQQIGKDLVRLFG